MLMMSLKVTMALMMTTYENDAQNMILTKTRELMRDAIVLNDAKHIVESKISIFTMTQIIYFLMIEI